MAWISLIICTKDRPTQLQKALEFVQRAAAPAREVEVVVVDNGATDSAKRVVDEFSRIAPFKTIYQVCAETGLGCARNAGVASASGEWLVFTDDDCYIDAKYFLNFSTVVQGQALRYGTGQILLYDSRDDPRVASLVLTRRRHIPAFMPMISAGTIQGANMFFHRLVFAKVGVFNPQMGSGTPFPCEDVEMASRASRGGFVGAQLPELRVSHHHQRLRDSPEALATIEGYDYGRGAYYASLIEAGVEGVWNFWQSNSAPRGGLDGTRRGKLARELQGAARYLERVARSATDQ
jgi:glycosyltransferase involved in cell wall biosynthesis